MKFEGFRQKCIEEKWFELLPEIDQLYEKYRMMYLSYELINHTNNKTQSIHKRIEGKLNEELKEKGCVGVGSYHKEFEVDIDDLKVNDIFFINREFWMFIHYGHIVLETFFQFANRVRKNISSCKPKQNISKKTMRKDSGLDGDIKDFLNRKQKNEEYEYLTSLDNYLKHQDSISIKRRSTNFFETILGDSPMYIVSGFKYSGTEYHEKEMIPLVETVKTFIDKSIEEYFSLISTKLDKERNYVVTDIEYEKQFINNEIKYVSFFITVPITEGMDLLEYFGDNIIYVRPIRISPDNFIFTDEKFAFEKLFIRNKDKEIVGKAELDITDKDLYYARYRVSSSNPGAYNQYINTYSQTYHNIDTFNSMAFTGIIKLNSHGQG